MEEQFHMDDFTARFPYIPERISGMAELATNLWWSWHPEARALFQMLNHTGLSPGTHNPVKQLHDLDRANLDAAATDPRFLRHYDAVMARFRSDMKARGGWFSTDIADPEMSPIAYFSAEFGLHHSLPFYAGGLGFLAGDFLKECSDLGVPTVGVGFMYPEGYLRQRISADGWQVGESETLDREHAPISRVLDKNGKPMIIKVPIIEFPIYLEVWKAQIGRVPLYLIDTDIEGNDPWNRGMSSRLYIGDSEQRLIQEIILGIGGTQVLNALGIKHSVLHLNEGHSAFALLERIREKIGKGLSYRDAVDQVRATTVFTTHTPVPAGHDVFPFPLMEKYFASYIPLLELSHDEFFALGIDPKNPSAGFNMTAFALRMSSYRNCVSKKHREVAVKMWQHLWPNLSEENVPIDYITNGVHLPTWLDSRMVDLFNRYLGPGWLDDTDNRYIWELVDDIPDSEIWRIHRTMKMVLIANMQERARHRWHNDHADPSVVLASGVTFDPNTLTIGFARRFATYKRATLVLKDPERLKRILNDKSRPIQLVFAGKAHPADNAGKLLIQQIFNAAKDPSFGGRVAFVEDYDEELAQYLVHGVDVWLNTPLPPFEASGTSGMKAEVNGTPQLSVMDGWWIEGYNGKNGWGFDGDLTDRQDARDAEELYTILEKEVIPLYYGVGESGLPHSWIKVMKEAIKSTAPAFSSRRMVKDYATKFYKKALRSASEPTLRL